MARKVHPRKLSEVSWVPEWPMCHVSSSNEEWVRIVFPARRKEVANEPATLERCSNVDLGSVGNALSGISFHNSPSNVRILQDLETCRHLSKETTCKGS